MATTVTEGNQQQQQQQEQNNAQGESPVMIDTQHDDMIHDAQLDYYGCHMATCSSDRTIKIFDIIQSTYTHTSTLQNSHAGPIWQLSWSHPKFGIILASCSFDGSVLFHRETRPREWTLLHAARDLHDSSVNSVQFAPHEYGLVCAAASSDGRVSVLTHEDDDAWSVEYLEDNALGVNAVCWGPYVSHASTAAAAASESKQQEQEEQPSMRLVTAGCDNRIRFWIKDPSSTTSSWQLDTTNSFLSTSLSHTDWVRDVAWAPSISPDVSIVASCSEDKTVLIWTQEGGPGNAYEPVLLHAFDEPVWRVSWSVTGSVLAVSSGDCDVTLWKAGLDGVWRRVEHVPDVVDGVSGGGAAAAAGEGGGSVASSAGVEQQ